MGVRKGSAQAKILGAWGDTALPGCWTFLLRAGQCGGGARQYLVFGTFTLDSWYSTFVAWFLVLGA